MKQLFLSLLLSSGMLFTEEPTFPWVVYYGSALPTEALEPYNPILLDRDYPFPLEPLLKKKKEVLGYVNLAEVEDRDPWFSKIKDRGLLIKKNDDWVGSWSIDIRHPYWKDLLLTEIIPGLISQGFTGLFFDQLDISLDHEAKEPAKYKGMGAAAVDLIHSIREKFPHQRIMMNRAYALLPEVGDDINYELAETLYTIYNFETKEYRIRSKQEIDWQLAQLDNARKQFPHLVMFSLDYWDPKDTEMYKKIYAMEREFCLRPYVSTPPLDIIISEVK